MKTRMEAACRRWRWAIVAAAGGSVIFGLAAANGHAWEMAWLPAVILGASWPSKSNTLRSCLRPRRRGEKQA
jgi:hypothetical protein